MTQPPPRRTPHVAFAALFAIALIGYAYAPLLSSWYIADDWHFFALYRHLDSPLSFVHENPVTSYFYRPIPLLLGSGAFALFELSGTGHYLLSVALHLWVAVEIYRLAMVDAVARTKAIAPIAAIAFATALLFVLFPLNAGTVAWISNRFDLMATAASLAAIRCAFVYVRAPRAGSLSAMSAWALVACLSKESGFAAIPACAFAVLAAQRFDLRARSVYLPIASLTAVVVGVFALRFMAMGFLFPPASELPQPVGYVEGVMRWTAALWLALRENTAAAVSLGLLLIGAIFMASMARVREWSPPWLAISVLIYAAVVIIAQAPIAKAAFPENATVSVSNRFFYSILASLFLVAMRLVISGDSTKSLSSVLKTFLLAAFTALSIALAHSTHGITAGWSRDTQFRRDATLALVRELQHTATLHAAANTRCAMRLSDEADALLNFDGTLDFALKAHLLPTDPAVNCLVIGKRPIATSFTRIAACEKTSFAPFRSISDHSSTIAVAGICKYSSLRE